MINIVIPMAGAGSRFSKEGYKKPKPFIDVEGKPMIVRVLENLSYKDARYILIARREHLEQENQLVKEIQEQFNVLFLPIEKLTEGTASTVLYARKYINNQEPLLIANSDQIIDIDISKFIDDAQKRELDGSMLTFIDKDRDPKWSFAKLNNQNMVIEVQEKVAISEFATVGIYLYSQGSHYVNAALDMIIENDRVNGEFYTCPTYNYAIKEGLKIGIYNINREAMHGIGTPADLNSYLNRIRKNACV
jgi:dTDP-glucose pyrophosphorylase